MTLHPSPAGELGTAARGERPPQRVVITGLGALTPIGCGADGLWDGVLLGKSAVREVSRFDATAFRSRLAAEIDDRDFDPAVYLEPRRARRLDRFSQLSVAASLQAIDDAGLTPGSATMAFAGCYLGSALGGVAFAEAQHQAFMQQGIARVNPSLALSVFGGAGPTNVAIELGLHGPSMANSNSCASGAIAIGEAFRLIRDGRSSLMLAGGAEAPLAPLTFGSFALIKAMSTAHAQPCRASRPFDVGRDGFVMGEGASMLVLESLEHALERGARMYAEVRGYGMTNDAFAMLAPQPKGEQAARAIRLAMDEAGVAPAQIDYVNAHASATLIGDRAEARAIGCALGEHAVRVPVSGTKGLYGHPLGASGAIETAICALAIARGRLPGTANLAQADADNTLNLIGPAGLVQQPRLVINNAFGFGGINAALVLAAV
ncbi:MAG: beta-ketoacyl-[acyl-carrier-protein] synthase family protein [Chloroflexota bacterium]